MDGLDIVWVIVTPSSTHSTGIDMVGNDVVIIRERPFAKGTSTVLHTDLSVHQLSHLGVRTDLPVSAWVLWIINSAYAHLA